MHDDGYWQEEALWMLLRGPRNDRKMFKMYLRYGNSRNMNVRLGMMTRMTRFEPTSDVFSFGE
jgi:hypothetical protein